MRLKNVEIYGFKSFAEKSKLLFEKNVCAIVGPNGSGKSNISDAVRWVLGEQSAKSLRGSNMQDVIFSGTETKKQMNMAQVSMTLDNRDKELDIEFDEVNVTRKVFRTGESEYLINNSPVRLKDIKELFMDTGIGKDGYSIIGQGRIDDILSGRAEDRRYIFEEASGIAKYKYKKNEAERKLVKNEESLTKIKSELKIKEQEVAILETQANNAKEGMKLTSMLEKMELSMLKINLERIDKELLKNISEKEKWDNDLAENNKRLAILNERITPISKQIDELEEKLEVLKLEAIQKDKDMSSANAEISVLNEKIKFLSNDLERIEKDSNIRNEKFENNKLKLNSSDSRLNELLKERVSLSEAIKKLQGDKSSLSKQKEKLEDEIYTLDMVIFDLREKLSKLNIDKSTKEQLDKTNLLKKEELLTSMKITRKDLDQNKKELSVKEQKLVEVEKLISDNSDSLGNLIDLRKSQQASLASKNEQINELNNEYYRNKSQRDVLYSIYTSYEGYYKPVQNLLKQKDKNSEIQKRIVGVLADLIEVDSKYKQAVDVTLSGALQNIVVNDENDAKYLIEYIKKNNFGRITFLPISKIHAEVTRVNHPLVIDTLSNLLNFNPSISGIINHFLGRTVLVMDMNDAVVVSKDLKGLRIVTLDGDIINSWGSMVGGNFYKKESNSLLNRKAELKKLDNALKEITEQGKALRTDIENLDNAFKTTINDLNSLDIDNSRLLNEKNNLLSDKKELLVKMDFNQKSIDDYERSIKQMDVELEKADFTSISDLETKLAGSESNRSKLNDNFKQLTDDLLNFEKDEIKFASNLEVVIRDISVLEGQIEDLKIENENMLSQNRIDIQSKASIQEDLDKSINKTSKLKIVVEEFEKNQSSESSVIRELDEKIKTLEANISKDRIEIDNLRDSINVLDRNTFQLGLKIENDQEKKEEIVLSYMENYDLERGFVEDKLQNLEQVKVTRKVILDVKNQLSKIGYFNYASIEEYQNESESLEFIRKQYDDLVATREDIIKMIKKLEKDMISLFNESFVKINEKFGEVFQVLFDGGQAQLLLDSDDVLTAGIEIIAKPPGKKLKNLGLLSGGEKALTAVALLFAIFEINPAPFCILDEIDAALDEANIKRYINYLKSMTDKTQFVIITHRKVTMEMADILYGVTMEEKGISKVITLALDNYREA
ncbi:MAG: chromosome segregation protein SMC [Tissierellia bacterium]|nr:chromosome segregation protein SMC [Tissierellia bacterium]